MLKGWDYGHFHKSVLFWDFGKPPMQGFSDGDLVSKGKKVLSLFRRKLCLV